MGNDSFPIELFQTPRGVTPRPTQVNKFWVKLRICDTYEKIGLFSIRFISELTKKQFHLFLIISLDFNSIHIIVNEILREWGGEGGGEKTRLHWSFFSSWRNVDDFDLYLSKVFLKLFV